MLGRSAGRALGRAVEQEIARQLAWAEYYRRQAWLAYYAQQEREACAAAGAVNFVQVRGRRIREASATCQSL